MVETWEIEWNSSMIEHGVDLGTMEFIFAKGGNLSDVNYVMLNQHDDTWEPLSRLSRSVTTHILTSFGKTSTHSNLRR